MKFVFSILIMFVFLVLSCGKNIDTAKADNTQNKRLEKTITAKVIENFNYTDYALSTEAEKAVISWGQYQELAQQISYLKRADLSFYKGDKKLVDDFVTALKTGIPENLDIYQIQSRVAIIETKILKLYDNLTLSNISTEVQLESIKETLIAFSNLNHHINWKMDFDFYNQIQPE